MPPPTTRITFEELQKLAAEVFDVDLRAVTSPYHDASAISLGALWSGPSGLHVEYRSIDISMRGLRDARGSSVGTHAFNVCFDVLEGILRRRAVAPTAELEQVGPPSTIRPRLAPPFEGKLPAPPPVPTFGEAAPSEPPEPEE
jgi:hypothetical protein